MTPDRKESCEDLAVSFSVLTTEWRCRFGEDPISHGERLCAFNVTCRIYVVVVFLGVLNVFRTSVGLDRLYLVNN